MFNERTGTSSDGGSLVFLLVAALHALPIILVAALTKSELWTWLTALVMAFVAVKFGSSSYALLDLIFVVGGLWLSLLGIKKEKESDNRFPSLKKD